MGLKMRESRVLKKLRAGEIVSSFKINLSDARIAEIAAISGFDCIWIDQEHIGQDWSVVASNVWATKTHDADLVVRVSKGSYSDYIRPLELDATGIMVPHVMSLAEAREIIEMTRFHPVGRRPIDGGNADGAYTAMDFREYLEQANGQRFVILQIEDPEPLEELDAIAALDGYDMLFFGPGDFSQGIGAPADWDNPRLLEARKRVADAANRHGKFAGTVGGPGNLDELVSLGYRFVNMGADVIGINRYCREMTTAFSKSASGTIGRSYMEE